MKKIVDTEKIKKTYDLPGRKWEKQKFRADRTIRVSCSFDEMLQQAIAERGAIDIVEAKRK